ncbi:MAG: type III pantothenate kinase [Muribaculaceae bacterium]|nr:type III pantothenate kinase [Muribaculaceae bacterium]
MEKYLLTLDRGNSSAKLALWGEDGRIVRHIHTRSGSDEAECVRLVLDAASSGAIIGAAYSSVVKDGGDEAVMNALREVVDGAGLCLELGADTPMPMGVEYATPATLGADRLAAALGALSLFGPGRAMLVVDMGSAITYDIVDPAGTYRGGNIAPGIQARFRGLHEVAPALPLLNGAEGRGKLPVFGDSTETAIRAGVVRGVEAEIRFYSRLLGGESLTVLTGGVAEAFDQAVGGLPGSHIEPDLIHNGLKRLFEYNETL